MLQKVKLSRRKALKLIFYSSLSTTILPLTLSCEKNISKNDSDILKTELDQAIAKIPSVQLVSSNQGLTKIPNSYVYDNGLRFDYVLVSVLDDGSYSLKMSKIEVVERQADFVLARGVEAYTNVLIYPEKNLKKLNKLDHKGLKQKFIKK